MANINLLPWRDEARKRRQKTFLTLLGLSASVVLAGMYGLQLVVKDQLNYQLMRNQSWEGELKILDMKVGEIRNIRQQLKALDNHIELIGDLDRERYRVSGLLTEVVMLQPPGLYLTAMRRAESALELRGKSESNNRVAQLLRAIQESPLFSSAELKSIVADSKNPHLESEFVMQVTLSLKGDGLVDSELRGQSGQSAQGES